MVKHIYVVGLRGMQSRLDVTVPHLQAAGLKLEIFYGIRAAEFGLRSTLPYEDDQNVETSSPYFISPGSVGCTLTHYMLWQHMFYSPHIPEMLVFEDDAILCDGFVQKFEEFYKELPADWQFAYVGNVSPGNRRDKVSNLISIVENPFGTHAYLVRRSALEILLTTQAYAWAPIDIQLFRRALPRLKYYCAEPSLVDQRSNTGEWARTCGDK